LEHELFNHKSCGGTSEGPTHGSFSFRTDRLPANAGIKPPTFLERLGSIN